MVEVRHTGGFGPVYQACCARDVDSAFGVLCATAYSLLQVIPGFVWFVLIDLRMSGLVQNDIRHGLMLTAGLGDCAFVERWLMSWH
jgi:hypothetical protein